MDLENSLLQYLNGKISFSEWIDGQSEKFELDDEEDGPSSQDDGQTALPTRPTLQKPDLPSSQVAESCLKEILLENSQKNSQQTLTGSRVAQSRTISLTDCMEPEGTVAFPVPVTSSKYDTEAGAENSVKNLWTFIKKLSQMLSYEVAVNDNFTDYCTGGNLTDISKPKRRKLSKSGPSSHKLREDLRQQMGVANLYLAKGKIEEAIDVCMEIVRQAPHNPHAFKTLSVIYDEKGDNEKALQYALVSAFIGSRDPVEWDDLARRCNQMGNKNQALLCYTRACKFSPKNILVQWEKGSLLFETKDYKKALDVYQTILKLIPNMEADKMIELCKEMAMLQHQYDLSEKAIDILEYGFSKFPANVDSEGLNILAELYISLKNYARALEVLCIYGGVDVRSIGATKLEINEGMEAAINLKTSMNTEYHLPETAEGTLSNESNEISSRIAQSLIDVEPSTRESRSNDLQIDLTSFPSSWTEYLLSSQKEPITRLPYENEIPVEDILDLDKQDSRSEIISSAVACKHIECLVPVDLPIDIRVKVAICLIQLKKESNIEHVLKPLLQEKTEDVGDLYLDIAETYIEIGHHEEAIPLLQSLVKCEKYSMPAVWLKLAECQQEANDLESSINSYYSVLELAPDQLGVRLELSNLCKSLGRIEESMIVLSDPRTKILRESSNKNTIDILEITNKEDFILWYQKCTILHHQKEILQLAENGYIFFMNYFHNAATARDDGLNKAVVWEMLVKVLQAMVSFSCHAHATEILDRALTFRPYCENKRYRLELDFLGATVFFLLKDYNRAFDMFRWALIRSERRALFKAATWNFFARIICNMHDRKHHKYVLRLLFKQPAILPLIITNGHNAFLCGSYKYALGEYIRAFRIKPTEPMLCLCIGITYLHLACQRFTKYRHTSVLQGMIFILLYYQMRGRNQEACFNIGRAFHQIGLVHLSVVFYEKAMSFSLHEEPVDSRGSRQFSQCQDLHREAAYNLALIYKTSGNVELAQQVLRKYILI